MPTCVNCRLILELTNVGMSLNSKIQPWASVTFTQRPRKLIEGGSKTLMKLESNQMFDPNSNCKVREAQIFLDVKIWSNPTIFHYWIKSKFFSLKMLWVSLNFTKDNEIWHNYTGSLDGTKACHGRQFNPDSNSKLQRSSELFRQRNTRKFKRKWAWRLLGNSIWKVSKSALIEMFFKGIWIKPRSFQCQFGSNSNVGHFHILL